MPPLQLTGTQYDRLSKALRSAFPTLAGLTMMVRFKLDRNLAEISLGQSLNEVVFQLIQSGEAEGWTAELLAGAREANPGNPQLLEFAQEKGMSAGTPALERTISQHSPFFDPVTFRTRLGEIEGQVCRIEVELDGGTIFGTGFLVGPGAVITNYHVLEPVFQGQAPPSSVLCRFDYKRMANEIVSAGTMFKLSAGDWLLDASPVSAADHAVDGSALPAVDELDYAILRLEGTPGHDPVGAKANPGSPPRGWISVSEKPFAFNAKTPLMVLQHPDAAPLKLALEMNGIIGLNANGTSRPIHGEHRRRVVGFAVFQHRVGSRRAPSRRRSELRPRAQADLQPGRSVRGDCGAARKPRETRRPRLVSSPSPRLEGPAEHRHGVDVAQVDGHLLALRRDVHLAEELQAAVR